MSIQIERRYGPSPGDRPVEIVERKGLGHPDTICDMLSEKFSVVLSKYYLERFGFVSHHNVDKALLSAGQSEPAFGGGRILKPIDLYLSGRATIAFKGERVPVREIAEKVVASWFGQHMHAFDAATGIRVHCLAQPGSSDLTELFVRQREHGIFLANDTSIGVGFAPLSELERVVLLVEKTLNSAQFKQRFPETGEDIKVMGVREHDRMTLTIACAFIGRFLPEVHAYRDAKEQLRAAALQTARRITAREVVVDVNTADDISAGEVYLTVTGTSAEAGDDGETGRGNRANGLITPYRPMTLEAVAGKNPITHVGKLYSTASNDIASALVAEVPGVSEAECLLVSQIGTPIDRPRLVHLRVTCDEKTPPPDIEDKIRSLTEREMARIPELWKSFLAAAISVA
ncbi:MAG: methionine adenosyltransferase [Hyphomicrobium sp.]